MALENAGIFGSHPLDRAGIHRTNQDWMAQRLAAPESLVLPIYHGRPYVLPPRAPGEGRELGFVRLSMLETYVNQGMPLVFLGIDNKDRAYFAMDLTTAGDVRRQGPLAELGKFEDGRGLAMELPEGDPALLSQALALFNWHSTHGYCAKCGAQTVMAEAGYKRDCPSCGAEHFPRTDPVVIMLATSGDKALLGRGKGFPDGMFSALAGFVEHGETLEEAVAREVEEEAGIKVRQVSYFQTQPWPYPYSLMIGCYAEAANEEIVLGDDELEEARWVDRGTIIDVIEGRGDGSLWVPPPMAIAHHLIRNWAFQE